MYKTITDIQDKIESIRAAIQEDYQFDNIQIILERSRTMINLQADIPSLLHAAMTLKSDCELLHIDDKLSTRKILCAARKQYTYRGKEHREVFESGKQNITEPTCYSKSRTYR